jgi:glutathione S-transferase
MISLYYHPGTCARASHIALREAGARFELVRVDFARAEQRSDAYLRINPKGRVPALATERGLLTETPAILAWIAQTHPDAQLAPLDDPFEFARLQAFTNYLCATVHVAHAHGPRGNRWADDPAALAELKRKVPDTMSACFDLIEQTLIAGQWVMGESYSIADPYLFTIAQWLPSDGVDLARFPRVSDHQARMLTRPAVQEALAAERA